MTHPSAASPGSRSEPPQPVRTAVLLMWVGAAISALSVIIAVVQVDTIREQLSRQGLPAGTSLDTVIATTIAVAVVVGAIGVALWVLMAVMNRRGKVWARIVATVLGALNVLLTLLTVSGAAGATPTLSLLVGVVSLVLAAVIVFLLWRPEASRWYEAMSRSAPAGA